MNDTPFVYVQYCDDVRFESHGKMSFMGLYSGRMLAHGKVPFSVPKIVAVAAIFLPLQPTVTELNLQLLWNEKVVQDVNIPSGDMRNLYDQAETSSPKDPLVEERGFILQSALALSPLNLDDRGVLRMDAIVHGTRYKGNSLIVEPTDQAPQTW